MRKSCSLLILSGLLLTAAGVSAQPPASTPAAPTPQAPAAPAAQAVPPLPAQAPGGPYTFCGQQVPAPSKLPPAGSPPVVLGLGPCFPAQGGVSVIEPETYLYYIEAKSHVSKPSQDQWVTWDDEVEKIVRGDFKRLWGTNFLDNLAIDVTDYTFANGVVGKLIAYNMEERQRVKIVSYEGSRKLEQTKIDEKLKEAGAAIRLDSFIDPGMVKRVKSIIQEMLAEKGYQYATITPEIKSIAGGPKLVNLTFHIDEGPQVKIRSIDFVGNKAIGDFKLRRQMKNNRRKSWISWLLGGGTYQEGKYEEDAEKVVGYFRDRGYIAARVGQPELKFIEDSADKRTRWVQLRIPVSEGERYRIGKVTFEGNQVVKSEGLTQLFKLRPGNWYSDKAVRKGLEKAREVYGGVGYFEFTGYPDLVPRDRVTPAGDEAAAAPGGEKPAEGSAAPATEATPDAATPEAGKTAARSGPPLVDVTMRLQEGKQYFVNRITFVGNTTTRDTVVRRELRLLENGVFNTEALKYSIKRINQLAYFKPLEGGKDVNVEKTPGTDNKVDVTLKFEEQNRNQLTFGAGVSQYEGYFGQLGFQTSNFMGRGETLSLSLQAGSRAQNYQVGFTEPYLFDRAITAGIDLYKRELRYISQFTQASTGGNVVVGFPLKDFTRMFLNYSYEYTQVKDLNEFFTNPLLLAQNPYLADSLLLGEGGSRTVSKVVPSVIHNTIDNPIFPSSGRRYTVSVDLAGLGGDTNFYKPYAEAVWYIQQSRRTSFGLRGQLQYIARFSGDRPLPIFEKLYLGGEYSIRGFDIRSVGPKAPPVTVQPTYNGSTTLPDFMPGVVQVFPVTSESGLVIGGNKSLLLNAEYLVSIAGPVRLVLFYDAGQALDEGERFGFSKFKTSTGAEIRFFMPVLNVPFRLIFAYNPQRKGVLDNNLRPQKAFSFRFAVGSTF